VPLRPDEPFNVPAIAFCCACRISAWEQVWVTAWKSPSSKGFNALLGVGYSIDSGGKDSQRSCGRVVPKRPPGHPAFNAHGRHKTDQVLSGYHLEMCAASESHPKDGNATLAWRAADDQRCRRATVLFVPGEVLHSPSSCSSCRARNEVMIECLQGWPSNATANFSRARKSSLERIVAFF
jgi:hypothetical protein